MNVSELIELLKTFPQELPVIFAQFSDFSQMLPTDISLITAESKKVTFRNGHYSHPYNEKSYPEGELPVYATVVCFPGN